ncbi:hypothetical protein E2562_022614 [Oryza meyeriana var. granulata]|uniref:NAC domain-containing protein n=1 Tax=Oryza meyeriana var. granulata TaxID=110450 RepID=A0A6G1CSY4_9ORYZ|nr:hypothetical protein E2562_022614 [Oryza meyeriana var. granulata]
MAKDDDGERVRSGWLMVELGLDVGGQDDDEELVLSKVYFSPRAPGARKPTATSSRHKRKLATTDIASPPPRHRRHRASSSPEEPLPNTDSYSPMADEPAPSAAPPQEVDEADRGSMSWWLRTLFGLTCTVDEADCIEVNPWLKDILTPPLPPPSPPTPPPPCPSPRREMIDMPEIREFFMRGPYRGSPPPPHCDPVMITGEQPQFDDQHRDDDDHARHHDSVIGQLQFDQYYRIGVN